MNGSAGFIKITKKHTIGVFENSNGRWAWRVWIRTPNKTGTKLDADGDRVDEVKHEGEEASEDLAHRMVKTLVRDA